MRIPSAKDIQGGVSQIDPAFLGSRFFTNEDLNKAVGCTLWLKDETRNPIGVFKGRGTELLVQAKKSEGVLEVVCASAGNFGLGVAFSARKHGLKATVFAAQKANPVKIQDIKTLAAKVILEGADFDAAKEEAKEYAAKKGIPLLVDGAHIEGVIGAGTIALEMTEEGPAFNQVLVALGNGALINGIGAWFKAAAPKTRIIGVCAEKAPSMHLSRLKGKAVETDKAETIADGVGVRVPIPEALEMMKETVDDTVLASEGNIREAIVLLHRHTGLVIEPAGAIGLAAILETPEKYQGRTIATILCGRNIDPDLARELAVF